MMTDVAEVDFIRPQEAVRRTGFSERTLRGMAAKGRLRCYRPTKNVTLYSWPDLKQLVLAAEVKPAAVECQAV